MLFVPNLKPNILSLGRLDEERFKIVVEFGYMGLYNLAREILATVKKTKGNLYMIKLVISGRCLAAT